jgi:hypothetical protein
MPPDFNEPESGLTFYNPLFEPVSIAGTSIQMMETVEESDPPNVSHIAPAGPTHTINPEEDVSLPASGGPTDTGNPGEKLHYYDAIEDHFEPGKDLHFFDAQGDLDPQGLHYFDSSDHIAGFGFIGHAFRLSIDYNKVIDSANVLKFLMKLDHAELRGENEDFDSFAHVSRAAIQDQAERYVEYLGYRPVNIIQKTLENTTQLATMILRFPMQRHIKSLFPHLNCS